MEKLINDSETFQKDRPLTITNLQRNEVLTEVAEDILEWNLSIDSVSNCYDCKKEYTDKDKEHGMCHKCWQPIIE